VKEMTRINGEESVVGAIRAAAPCPLLPAVQQPADPRSETCRPCREAAAASAARMIRSVTSGDLRLGLDCVCVKPEHLGCVRAVVH
jgi:hypothetical protein